MSRKVKPYLQSVVIEAVAAEGNGLAHVDGKVLFVQQAIPGDVVDVQVNKVRSGYMQGYIVNIVKPSQHRLKPFCEHYGDCGGCTWQPLPYEMQLAFKQQQVTDQLTRIGHLHLPAVSPILGSEKQQYYRNKLEYTFSAKRWILANEDVNTLNDKQRLGLGFHVSGFFDKVLDIKDCHLQREPSNAIRLFIRQYAIEHGLSFFDLREQHGFLRTLMIRTTSTGENMLVVVFGPDAIGKPYGEAYILRNELLNAIAERFPEITSLYYVLNPKANDTFNDLECVLFKGAEAVYENMGGLRFKIGPKSFYQTNSEQAFRLYSVVKESVKHACECLAKGVVSNSNDSSETANGSKGASNGSVEIANDREGASNNCAEMANDREGASNNCAEIANGRGGASNNCAEIANGRDASNNCAEMANDQKSASDSCMASSIGNTSKPIIYDLYTGTGTIALFLSDLASKVVGIEYVPEAIGDARVNAAENNITNSVFVAGDMKDVLNNEFITIQGRPDIIVLDPPRAGIHPDVAQVIMEASPAHIIYVSCNPATQARDLAIFAKNYTIVKVQPVDMFPHTIHVENVVELVKNE